MQNAFQINQYEFSDLGLEEIQSDHFAKSLWPVVYILNDGKKREAYVGESTNIVARIQTHLANEQKNKLSSLELITSDKFNKSAALDIESNLIRYMAADRQYELLNSNLGIANHNYYQKKELYQAIFESIWDGLRSKGIAKHSLLHLNNSDIFKYSPYKSLSLEQEQGLANILHCLNNETAHRVVVEGGAGTGKSILAIYLFKLLLSNDDIYTEELGDSSASILKTLVDKFKQTHSNPKLGLVVSMTSFRNTLKKVFRNIKGLNANMVLSPSEATKEHYDLLVVDESHRLRRRINLGAYFGQFDQTCAALGLDRSSCSELDWMLLKSNKTVLFYDDMQSIKPSDALPEDFAKLKTSSATLVTKLKSQFRSMGGNQYSSFLNGLFDIALADNVVFQHKDYEFKLYESLSNMVEDIKQRNRQYGLSRLVAGYAWPWVSKNDKTKNVFDIEIGDVRLRWNATNNDWINSEGSENEVGCIHTTQGYDLNYTGVILGPEISYDPIAKKIVVIKDNYHDKNGKNAIEEPEKLKNFIINIYKTILLRAIRGTYIYVCDPHLKEYLAQHISVQAQELKWFSQPEILPFVSVKPYENAVPLYDIKAAAGDFSEQQDANEIDWVALPENMKITEDYFACLVVGESMNKVIPNGSLCLFKKRPGGSRNGKIVLVQHHDIDDPDNGGSFTVKTYFSEKIYEDGHAINNRIILRPESTSAEYQPIVIENSEGFDVIAEFIQVLR